MNKSRKKKRSADSFCTKWALIGLLGMTAMSSTYTMGKVAAQYPDPKPTQPAPASKPEESAEPQKVDLRRAEPEPYTDALPMPPKITTPPKLTPTQYSAKLAECGDDWVCQSYLKFHYEKPRKK